jgi:hypothetical protein
MIGPGLDFGNPADIRVELQREAKPRGGLLAGLFGKGSRPDPVPVVFSDHPMCVNTVPKIQAQLEADPSIARAMDDDGWTLLHREALAGNLGVVKLLIAFGADPAAQTPAGYIAADLARKIGWPEIADFIQSND